MGAGAKAGRIGQQRLEELDGDNLLPLKQDGRGGEHAHIFQTAHVGQIALAEGHEEPDAPDAGDILCQRLDLLVVQQIHILLSHLIEVILPLDAHSGYLHPVTILPKAAGSGDLPQVDLRVKIGGKGVAVVAAIAVQNVDGVELVKFVLCGIGTVCLCHAGVKAAAQQGGEPGLFKLLPVCPLPAVIEIGGETLLLAALFIDETPLRVVGILRLIVGGIHIVDATGQAGIHNGKILVGKGNVHHQVRLIAANQVNDLLYIVGVHLGSGNFGSSLPRQLCGKAVALALGAACNAQLGKNFADLTAFGNGHRGYAAAANH